MAGMSLAEAIDHITTTNPLFAVGEADIRGLRLPVFENTPQTLRAFLYANQQGRAWDDYIVYQDERISYSDYCAQINRLAHTLSHDLGVQPGDQVAIAMRNYPEYLVLMLAITHIGAVAVLINAWWTSAELRYGFEDSGAKLVFADGPRYERILPFAQELGITLVGVRDGEALATLCYQSLLASSTNAAWPTVPINADDDSFLMYSSGSTGHPKGVVQTHRGAMTAVYSWLMALQLPPLMAPAGQPLPPSGKPSLLCATPLFHVTATHPIFLLSIALGSKLVLMHKWDADAALHLIQQEQITRILGVPTMTADIGQAAARLGLATPSLEYFGSGGAKRPAAQVGEQAKQFPNVSMATGWGMTETNALGIAMAGPDYVQRPDHAGRLIPPLQQLRIVDDNNTPLPNGSIGEISVKSAAVMRCYLNKPAATADALRDGWLLTGDLGVLDDEGFVRIVGRKKEIIIRGGENISCLEVEGAMHQHPAVAEATVFSMPDERLGEVVGGAAYLKAGYHVDADEMQAFLSQRLAAFKIPVRYWWFDQPLPRGATDKIDRRLLREHCLGE